MRRGEPETAQLLMLQLVVFKALVRHVLCCSLRLIAPAPARVRTQALSWLLFPPVPREMAAWSFICMHEALPEVWKNE